MKKASFIVCSILIPRNDTPIFLPHSYCWKQVTMSISHSVRGKYTRAWKPGVGIIESISDAVTHTGIIIYQNFDSKHFETQGLFICQFIISNSLHHLISIKIPWWQSRNVWNSLSIWWRPQSIAPFHPVLKKPLVSETVGECLLPPQATWHSNSTSGYLSKGDRCHNYQKKRAQLAYSLQQLSQ